LYSIIVVNHDGGSLLVECLNSVFRHTDNFELILVDNASSDGSFENAVKLFPRVTPVKNEANLGFAKANNVGIQVSQGEWIVLLNPDTTVTEGWLEALAACTREGKNVGIVTPKLLRKDKKTIDSAGQSFDFMTAITKDRGAGEFDQGQYEEMQDISSCSFACALIARRFFDEIGFLDERMIIYYEDVDLCLRGRIAGWRVLYCPRSVVYHSRGGLTPISFITTQRQAVAYRLRIILKCYDRRNAMLIGAARVVRDVISTVAGIKNNDSAYSYGYIRSPFWNLFHLPVKERILAQSRRRVSDEEIAKLSL
jgi:GT2 family glycosyltransferase